MTSVLIHYLPTVGSQIKTNIIDPNLFDTSGLLSNEPAVGEIRLTRSIEQHPTATVKLFLTPNSMQTLKEVIDEYKLKYRSGTQVRLLGRDFNVSSLVPTEASQRKNLTHSAEFQLSLTGKWAEFGSTRRNPLDEPYKVENRNNLLLSEAIALSGNTYIGNDLTIYLEGNSKVNVIQPRQQLINNARTLLGFAYYSNDDGLEIRSWGQTAVRNLAISDVKNERLSNPMNGYGTIVDGCPLVEEFRNTRFTPKQIVGNSTIQLLVEYENCSNEGEFLAPLYESDQWAIYGEQVLEPFKNGNNTFDNSSQTKTKRLFQVKNGERILTSETVKGWEYYTTDFYDITGNSITWNPPSILVVNGFWKTVKTSSSPKFYDVNGWWLGDSINGTIRARFKQETGRERSIEQQNVINAAPAELFTREAIRDTYNYFNLPIAGNTIPTPAKFSDYFVDIRPGVDNVEPLFVIQQNKTELNIITAPDPGASEDRELTDMVTGRDFFESKTITVLSPVDRFAPQEPETYREVTYTRNAEGEGLGRYARNAGSKQFPSRPGVAPRLIDLDGDYQQPTTDLISGVNYFLRSENAEITVSNDLERSSVGYENVFTLFDLQRVAEADLSFKNRTACTTNVTLVQPVLWDEGDVVNYRNEKWTLNSMNLVIAPERENNQLRLINKQFVMSLGRYLKPGVNIAIQG